MGERLDKTLIDDRIDDPTGDEAAVPSERFSGDTNRFESRGTVARGGMGSIIDVYDHRMERQVAMKVLHQDLVSRQGELETFVREAQITGQLDHPNIVPVHDMGHEGAPPWFSMKLVQGKSLAEVFRRLGAGKLPGFEIEKFIKVMIKVCDAVAFAHSRGVLHLDLKPHNIMVGSHGQVYVMDWGIAVRCARGEDGHLRPVEITKGLRGTLAYMAPEQARRGLAGVDERSDVYGLGAILYEFLTGRPPFEPRGVLEDVVRVVENVVLDPLESPTLRQPPPGLAAIAVRALARDPAERYPDVTTMQGELEALMRGGGWFRERHFGAGSVIVQEGEPGESAYILTRGRCDVFKRSGERSVHLRRIGPGDVFGETAILTSGRRTASVVAVDEVTVLVVTREALERELDTRGWLGPLVRALAERFVEADEERARLRTPTAPTDEER
ncbi:serine/threonine-protein kinase [Paraliomyxa miuraensis]|uniref:serine/threonine-protein kinase n=1 Tax=Paraliomyxa miuraensis TaxID=376150 RepID=UPI002255E785|nr:serine/threonine-protein kinase [Paraliomyxa miuraensis]MCX4244699.1 serine/threonine-protein kinase [Paraliomyxa miuraensis]